MVYPFDSQYLVESLVLQHPGIFRVPTSVLVSSAGKGTARWREHDCTCLLLEKTLHERRKERSNHGNSNEDVKACEQLRQGLVGAQVSVTHSGERY